MVRIFSTVLFALLIAIPQLASASVLVQYQGTAFIGVSNQNEPLSKVVVGASNVTIGGFGVYGQPIAAGHIKFIIFDNNQKTSPVYLSSSLAIAADPGNFAIEAQWYDSPTINFTLLAGHTYAMGLISDQVGANSFRWGSSDDTPFGPYPTITANGLSLPFMQALDNSGEVGSSNGVFTNTPTLYSTDNSNRRDMALRILSDPPVATPEPATMALMGLGLAGMGVFRRCRKRA